MFNSFKLIIIECIHILHSSICYCLFFSVPCMQLVQELFHKCGLRFVDTDEIYTKLEAIQEKWFENLVPAMTAVYSTMDSDPVSNEVDG